MSKDKIVKKTSIVKGKGKLSPYNKYMKAELPKVKAADTSLTHLDAFKIVAKNWANASENPKNAK